MKNKLEKLFINIMTFNFNILQVFAFIFIYNLLLFCITYASNGMFFVDTSREVYIPMQMNDGAVLYKDIFNVYAPLGYQVNAVLIKLFGENLRTFYFAGFLNSTFFLFGLYLLARILFKHKIRNSFTKLYMNSDYIQITHHSGLVFAFLYVLFIIVSCVYSVSLTNYIFPYSYSMVYALNAIIWSLVCILYFMKRNNVKFLYFACLFYGASISFKYEFSLLIFVLIPMLYIYKTSIKEKLISIFSISVVPVLSFTDLILKGVTISDLKMAFSYMVLLAKSKSALGLYTYLGFIPTFNSIKSQFLYFFIISLCICICFGMGYLIIKLSAFFVKNPQFINSTKNKLIVIFLSILIPLLFGFIYGRFCISRLVESNAFYFSWSGIAAIIIFLGLCFILLRKKNQLTLFDKMFFVLFLSTILVSYKCIFNISFNSYGTYYFPLIFLCILTFILNYIPGIKVEIKNPITLKTDILNLTMSVIILFLCIGIFSFYYSNCERSFIVHPCVLEFEKGFFRVENEIADAVLYTVDYINNNTKKEDTILVLPEGAMINFLTDRKSHNKYYYLIPPNIEIFGEENIVKDLTNDLPDYIVIQPMSYLNFGETYFCDSFGTKICSIIPQYYQTPIVFGKDFKLAIYKKKS